MPFEDMNHADQSYRETLAENYGKLNVAVELMHQCFEPAIEPRTNRDVAEDIMFGTRSELKRINFNGFYTVLLERDDALISVATLRAYGDKMAEIPLVGTRAQYRRLGMCRVLMDEMEKRLKEVGVQKLVLPAVPSAINTWTGSFGFSVMPKSQQSELRAYTFLNFHHTVMCQKHLNDLFPSAPSIRNADSNAKIETESKSGISEVVVNHEGETEGSVSVDQWPASVTGCNGSDCLAPGEINQTPSSAVLPFSNSTEKKAELPVVLEGEEEMVVEDGTEKKAELMLLDWTEKEAEVTVVSKEDEEMVTVANGEREEQDVEMADGGREEQDVEMADGLEKKAETVKVDDGYGSSNSNGDKEIKQYSRKKKLSTLESKLDFPDV